MHARSAIAASPSSKTPLWLIFAIAAAAGAVGSAAVLSANEFLTGARVDAGDTRAIATVLEGPDRPMPTGLVRPSAAIAALPENVQVLAANSPRFGGKADLGATRAFAFVDRKSKADTGDDEPVTLAALAEAKQKPTKAVEAAAPKAKASGPITGKATTNDDVNIRSGANSKSPVIGVIPRNSAVDIVKCASWCEIVYDGKHGYIYSGFVGGKGAPAKSTAVAKAQTGDGKVKSSVTLEPKRKWWPFGKGNGDQGSAPVPAFN